MKSRWLLSIALVIPVLTTLFIWDLGARLLSENGAPSVNDINVPQTIVENTDLVEFDRNGTALHWLRSQELRTDGLTRTVYITSPIISIDPNLESTWDAMSAVGVYSQNEKKLRLSGGVTLTKREQGIDPIVLTTDQLDFFPEKNVAESDTPVTIETKGHKVETVGIRVDFDASIYKLNSKVKSTHEPF